MTGTLSMDLPRSEAARAHEESGPLSQLIDIVNQRFGTDFNEADQLFFDQIVEAAVADDELRETAAVNPEGKFDLVFRSLIERLFVERMDQNEDIFVRYMNDHETRDGSALHPKAIPERTSRGRRLLAPCKDHAEAGQSRVRSHRHLGRG